MVLNSFGIKDILDIVLVAFLIFYIYRLMKKSSAANIFSGIIVFLIVWLIFSQIFNLRLMGTMLNYIVNIGALALVVLFQEEIRRFLSTIGTGGKKHFLINMFRPKNENLTDHTVLMPIVLACMNMSREHVGALIVVEKQVGLKEFVNSGDLIDANINQRLIENIFFKNSPLHDGAMIVQGKRIAAAGCIMPVSHEEDIPKSCGLRHRAALGISEKTDALAIVVSEETGHISAAHNGKLYLNLTADELENLLFIQ